jgi:hypothetical protein
MDDSVAGKAFLSMELQGRLVKIGHPASCFLDHQNPGSHIPGFEFHFPEAVETP